MKPSIPQGTRDFDADVVKKRQYIFQTIQRNFELLGFQPLETPAFENIETLMGKYGEEGDKLIFKILNNGFDRPEKHQQAKIDFEKVLEGKSIKGITERALKYDLTIPFARYVAMNHAQLNMPFKRYQIQTVWRADRPQRGRYREFTQCDADVVGSKSLLNEIELISIYQNVFQQLNVPVIICINNRKILAGLAELCGGADLLIPITVAIDKLDKIGIDKVIEELKFKGISDSSVQIILEYLNITNGETPLMETIYRKLRSLFENIPIGKEGIIELEYVGKRCHTQIDLNLARGLNYYTGTIIEVKPYTTKMGSIGGGGRYDDLTGLFGVKDIAGVGISFGVDRIYDVMDELNLFPESISNSIDVMLVNFGAQFDEKNFEVLKSLRAKGISCELYPDAIKFDKQLKYANKRNALHIGMIGEDELKENMISIKNFTTGEQRKMKLDEIVL